jgi:hypothetical protein
MRSDATQIQRHINRIFLEIHTHIDNYWIVMSNDRQCHRIVNSLVPPTTTR